MIREKAHNRFKKKFDKLLHKSMGARIMNGKRDNE